MMLSAISITVEVIIGLAHKFCQFSKCLFMLKGVLLSESSKLRLILIFYNF